MELTSEPRTDLQTRRHLRYLWWSGWLLIALACFCGPALRMLQAASGARDLSWGPLLFRILLALHGVLLVALGSIGPLSSRGPRNAEIREPRRTWVALGCLSVAALALRLWGLNSELWLDEVLTLVDFSRRPLAAIVTDFSSQNQHMAYSVLSHLCLVIFGESAWALRLPAVMFGIAGIWAVFLLARRLAGTPEALLVSAVMTFSYHHIWFSQNARGYTGLLCFATLATWLWLEALARDDWRWWAFYSASLTLGAFTNLNMVFVPMAHVLIHAVRGPRLAPKPVAAWLLAATTTLQLYALSLPGFLREALHEASRQSEWTSIGWMLAEARRGLGLGLEVLALAALLVCAAGLASLWRRDARAAAALALPGLLAGGLMAALGHNLWPRFFFFCMGFALIVAVRGAVLVTCAVCAAVTPLRSCRRLAIPGLAAAAVAFSILTLPRNYALPKQDFSGARDFVERNRAPADAVVSAGLASTVYTRYLSTPWHVVETRSELDALRRKAPAVWLVYTLPIDLAARHPGVWEAVNHDFELVKVFPGTLGGGQVSVCRAGPPRR